MKLPSPVGDGTTETVGFFEAAPPVLASWLSAGPERWTVRPVRHETFADLVRDLAPSNDAVVRALFPVGGRWTAMLTSHSSGTDVGMIPSLAARQVGCRAMRAVAIEPTARQPYRATMLEVYDPAVVDDILKNRRTIYAADDGGTWRFGQGGEPFEFEDLSAYQRRRKRDRFDPEMLHRYLVALGIPAELTPELDSTLFVEEATPWASAAQRRSSDHPGEQP